MPLDVANNADIIELLIAHGAVSQEDVRLHYIVLNCEFYVVVGVAIAIALISYSYVLVAELILVGVPACATDICSLAVFEKLFMQSTH